MSCSSRFSTLIFTATTAAVLLAFSPLLLLPAAVRSDTSGDAGSTGAAFLELGIGARAAALGEAQVAWADDIYGPYFNPAGIATRTRQQIGFTHNTLFLDLDYNYLGYLLPLSHGGVLGISGLYVDLGGVDRREVDAAGDPTASLGRAEGSDLAFSATYARTLRDFLDLGATVKILNERLADHSASAFAVDLGAKWRPPVPGLTLGLSLSNLGTSLKFVRESDDLPITLRLGAGYRSSGGRWGLVGDVVWVKNQDFEGKIGGEVWVWPEHLAFRAGANSANDAGRGFTVGAAFKWNDLNLDYAYVPFGSLGDQNLISLAYDFGPRRRPEIVPRKTQASRRERTTTAPEQQRPPATATTPTFTISPWGIALASFVYQSGPADYSWIGPATAEVFRHDWKRYGILYESLPGVVSAPLYRLDGNYWVFDNQILISASIKRNGTIVNTYTVTGPASNPFDAWKRLEKQVNAGLRGLGMNLPAAEGPPRSSAISVPPPATPAPSVSLTAVSRREAPNPEEEKREAPVAVTTPQTPPEEARKPVIVVDAVREYPSMTTTNLSKALADEIRSAVAGDPALMTTDAEAPRFHLRATMTVLEGGDLFLLGKIIDTETGIPLARIEVNGSVSKIKDLAEKVAEELKRVLPR